MLTDITAPEHVEVVVREDGKVLWVNVDGECRLRICRITKQPTIRDQRLNANKRSSHRTRSTNR